MRVFKLSQFLLNTIISLFFLLLGQSFKSSTEERLKDYSRSGLRTLVMAKRVSFSSLSFFGRKKKLFTFWDRQAASITVMSL